MLEMLMTGRWTAWLEWPRVYRGGPKIVDWLCGKRLQGTTYNLWGTDAGLRKALGLKHTSAAAILAVSERLSHRYFHMPAAATSSTSPSVMQMYLNYFQS